MHHSNNTLALPALSLLTLGLLGCGGGGGGNGSDNGGDRTSPAVASVTPADRAAGVALTSTVSVRFSEAMDCASVNADSFALKDASENEVSGRVTCSGSTATFTPAAPLSIEGVYTARLTTAMKDKAGNALAEPYTWHFTARARAWSAPTLLEHDDGGSAYAPQFRFDTEGNAMVIWAQDDGSRWNIWASRYTPATGWSVPVLVEHGDGTAGSPQIALDRDGNAIAVWVQHDGNQTNIWSSRYTPSSGWSTPALIGDENAPSTISPRVAIDASGNGMATWTQHDGIRYNLWANHYAPDTGWSTPALVETDDAGSAYAAEIAYEPNGSAWAVWQRHEGISASLLASHYTPGTGWGSPVPIENEAGACGHAQLAVDSRGNTVVLWAQQDGTRYNIWSTRYTPGAGWESPTLIENENGNASSPQLAVDGGGNALVVWYQEDGTRYNTWSTRYTPDKGWDTPLLIESSANSVGSPQIAFDAKGNAFAIWEEYEGDEESLWFNRYTVDVGWSTAENFESRHAGNSTVPQLAFDNDGNALAVWTRRDDARDDLWSRRFE